MDIYFDESRNTGELGFNKDKKSLNYGNQRYFILAGFINNEEIIKNYIDFKNKWIKHINKKNPESTIIKGNDLVIRENNKAMEEFIDSIINHDNFYITVYDKKFFIVTQMINWLTTMASDYAFKFFMYFTEFIIKVNDEFISKYIYVTKNSTKENIIDFINYVIKYPYNECINTQEELIIKNVWIDFIEKIMNEDNEYVDTLFKTNVENVMIKGSDRNNIVNLTALGETILILKRNNPKIGKLQIFHDNIEIVQDYISNYWNNEIRFINDSESIQIQIVDNLTSVLGNLINKIYPINSDEDLKKLINSNFDWARSNLMKIYNKIDNRNIKMVISLREIATLKAFLERRKYKDIKDFKCEIFKRLNIRYFEEMSNHISYEDALKIFNS